MSEFINQLLIDDEARREHQLQKAEDARRAREALWTALRAWWTPFTEEVNSLVDEWNSKVELSRRVVVGDFRGRSAIQLSNRAFDLTFWLEEKGVAVSGRTDSLSAGRQTELFFTLTRTANAIEASRGSAKLVNAVDAAEDLLRGLLPKAGDHSAVTARECRAPSTMA
jgi:hypothetical protein